MSQLRRRRSATLVVGAVAALVLNASVSSATESVTTSIAGTESCPAGSVVRFYVTTTYSQARVWLLALKPDHRELDPVRLQPGKPSKRRPSPRRGR